MESTLAVDLDTFAQSDFNAIEWINSLLQPSHTIAETTELIAQVQSASHDTSRRVGQITDGVINSMPRLLNDLKNLENQVQDTQREIKALQSSIPQTDPVSLEQIRQLHDVKTRMEQTRIALREAEISPGAT